jgi:diaminohydroxyphosphoribosylaminopyrimidine deaminase / 5-amino-6-(5-phosphoribosylamino)uracil reductase
MDQFVDRRFPSTTDDLSAPLFAPLRAPVADGRSFVLGRVAQSLDGYIATRDGESVWISGPDDLRHTHRLRALSDAVIVGARTVRSDDPRLTTRLVPGPNPVRVVLDPDRRLGTDYRVFQDGPATLLICAADQTGPTSHGAAEVIAVPRDGDGLRIDAIITCLRDRGLKRLFVEGGGVTVSRFLEAGVMNRLHVTVAPLIMGGGIPAFPITPVARLQDGRRFAWTAHPLGADVLLDIPVTDAT